MNNRFNDVHPVPPPRISATDCERPWNRYPSSGSTTSRELETGPLTSAADSVTSGGLAACQNNIWHGDRLSAMYPAHALSSQDERSCSMLNESWSSSRESAAFKTVQTGRRRWKIMLHICQVTPVSTRSYRLRIRGDCHSRHTEPREDRVDRLPLDRRHTSGDSIRKPKTG